MLALLSASLVLIPPGLSVGRAQVDLTPEEPLPLGGYTERGPKLSEPGGEKLFARSLMLSGSGQTIAIVSVECLTIPESLVREVKNRIPEGMTLFLAATHTHSAPDSQMLNDRMTFSIPGIASYKSKWLTWYADKIAGCIKDSAKSTKTISGLEIGEARVNANQGRRKYADPDTLLTALYAQGTDFYHPLTLSRAWGVSSPLTFDQPMLIEYAAHGTVLGDKNMKTSGDWPSVVSRFTGAPVLQGAIGDVLPREIGANEQTRLHNMGLYVLEGLTRTKRTRVWEGGAKVGTVEQPIQLDPVQPHPTMAKAYSVPEAFASSIVKQFAPPSATITALRFGKVAIIGVPGEPTSELGRRIVAAGSKLGFRSVLVCSHVNGWMGYILGAEDYDRGGYEATLSFYGREEGDKVVQAASEALRKLAAMPVKDQ